MSDAVAAPVASSAPAIGASSAPDAAAPPAAAPRVSVGGREYDAAEIEAALAARASVTDEFKTLAQQQADFASKVAAAKTPAQVRKLLADIGVDAAQFSEDTLIEAMENEKLTPEQRELKTLREEKAAAQKAKEDASKADAEAKAEAKANELRASYETQFMSALTDAGLPKTVESVQKLAGIVREALDAGFEVTPAEAATLYRARYHESVRADFKSMTPAQVRDIIGSDVWASLLKEHQAGLKAQTTKEPDARPAKAKQADVERRKAGTSESIEDVLFRLRGR